MTLKQGILSSGTPTAREWLPVCLLQAFFLITALFGLDAPFVSMHFVRQNYTFDVAQHVFHDGWNAVITPRASFSQLSEPDNTFSPLPHPSPRITISHLQVPFNGLFGWPAALMFPQHERAVARLVSVAFALLSIGLLYLILRQWLEPPPALAGTALWTTAPLILHFGQVPTPDILATSGMAAAFLFALRGNPAASSAAFLFGLLTKPSIILYGLPILVALLLAKDCRSFGQFLRISLAWGIAPLAGLAAWLSLGFFDPPGSWVVMGGYRPGEFGPLHLADLAHPGFCIKPLIYIVPFGCGLLGVMGLFFTARNALPGINRWLCGSIALALLSNYLLERVVWIEAQYTLPVLFWVVFAASLGFPQLLDQFRQNNRWKMTIAGLLIIHIATVCVAVNFLKTSRVPNIRDLEAAGQLTPADARIVVYAATPNASPSMWLNRNTLKLDPLQTSEPAAMELLAKQLQSFHEEGFDYFLVFDVTAHASMNPLKPPESNYCTNFTNPASPFRQFFDARYRKIFEGDHAVLYLLTK